MAQDMPYPTHPGAFAVTGTNRGTAMLVGADGDTGALFVLPASVCMPLVASGVTAPRYWDGTQCLRHPCIRARSCGLDQSQVCYNGYHKHV